MLRRNPTRIELKLTDIETEYEVVKKEQESERSKNLGVAPNLTPLILKTKSELINERIGYDPKPKPQTSHRPIVN
ncbi:anaphase-promoting complex subunit CDC26-like isoform X2 [Mya arenaria]|nr:anaphase-promoting complex subunit CDC26-like isoform X2 [Mya arenaria]